MAREANKSIESAIPATRAASVTPNNSTVIEVTRALYVGGSGDVAVTMAEGGDVTFVGASGILPVQVTMVKSTGTTATGILALY